MAIHIALALALAGTLALAVVLLVWAHQVAGARLLTVFLLGVAAWVVGNELPNWLGPRAMPAALALLATVPLTSAAFLHFCVVFCGVPVRRAWLLLAYAVAAAATLLSLVVTPGRFEHFEPFTGVQWVVVPNWAGWTTSLVWALLAAAGIVVLLRGWHRATSDTARRQIGAVTFSCGWGLVCMSGYGFAALQIPVYPWQVLAVPAYPVILVYGILRYRVFVANAWARRALVWAILLTLGLLVVLLTLWLPMESRWLGGAAVAATCLALNGPVRRVAERLVYPGGTVSAADLAEWRRVLGASSSYEDLGTAAAELLSRRVRLEVDVVVGEPPQALTQTPTLVCRREPSGWQVQWLGWDAAPPGPRHVAELFGTALADAAAQVEHATLAREREREQQQQARLAELGSLAASVAHDLRNPLNIISMAVAMAPAETRREVAGQVARISHLADDLLDYARPWRLQPVPLDLAQQVREAARHVADVELGTGLDQPLMLTADPSRVGQVLANLLSNARAAAGSGSVRVDGERTDAAVQLHVCDDGPGVPEDLRERIFQPFVSRSAGGTGLGLAIVDRIMKAHGGSVTLTDRPPWRTCFTLSFPVQQDASLARHQP